MCLHSVFGLKRRKFARKNTMGHVLKIKIEHSNPVDLHTFCNSLDSVSSLFTSYANKNGVYTSKSEVGLYVEKVKEGSIELFLGVGTAAYLTFAENANIILDFAKFIKDVYDYYTNLTDKKPDMDLSEMKHYHDMLNMVANDNHGVFNIQAVDKVEGNVYIGCSFNNTEGNGTQNKLRKDIESEKNKEPKEESYNRVLMTIYQMRNDSTSDKGNKAVISSISDRKLGLLFNSEELKSRILYSDVNPTKIGYLVDVVAMVANDKMAAYKVTALHDMIELDDDEEF